MLQHLLSVSLEQQGGHAQAVGVEPFELRIKEVNSFFMGKKKHPQQENTQCCFYLGDVKFLQSVQKGSENWRHLRLQGMAC